MDKNTQKGKNKYPAPTSMRFTPVYTAAITAAINILTVFQENKHSNTYIAFCKKSAPHTKKILICCF